MNYIVCICHSQQFYFVLYSKEENEIHTFVDVLFYPIRFLIFDVCFLDFALGRVDDNEQ
jgi:hypothetical protein